MERPRWVGTMEDGPLGKRFITFFTIVTLLLSAWVACRLPPRSSDPTPPPTPKTAVVRVIPVIVTSGGNSPWLSSPTRLPRHREFASEALTELNVVLEWVDPVELADEALFEFSGEDMIAAYITGLRYQQDYKAKVLLYVNDLPGEYAGYTLGEGVAVIAPSLGLATAHELGHLMGLWHTWNSSTDGVECFGPDDCDTVVKRCNVMGYCNKAEQEGCVGARFSLEQANLVRKWLTLHAGDGIVRWAD